MSDDPLLNMALVRVERHSNLPLEYINRGNETYPPSPLANPFFYGRTARDWPNFKFYRAWLWAKITERDPLIYPELLRLLEIARNSILIMGCHCATQIHLTPRPIEQYTCHGEVIGAALNWLINSGDK